MQLKKKIKQNVFEETMKNNDVNKYVKIIWRIFFMMKKTKSAILTPTVICVSEVLKTYDGWGRALCTPGSSTDKKAGPD